MGKSNFTRIVNIIGFLSIILFSSDLLFSQDTKKDDADSKLTKRIEYLETLVKGQQKQIESLQKEILKLKFEKPMVTLPADSALNYFSEKFPNGARPFKFNGRTYYMVPLSKLNDSNADSFEKK
ncbi:hypothetical protein C0389_02715 [bacterium]|nr:hypothetical protein [bacterium]